MRYPAISFVTAGDRCGRQKSDMGAREQLRVRVGVKTKKKGGAEAPPLIELPGLLQNW
jgi:hypothetical protein